MSKTAYQPLPILGDTDDLFSKKKHVVPQYARPDASINANNDLALVIQFLGRYEANKRTVASYRSELERLLQWTWHKRKKSILDLTDKDLTQYIKFSQAPPKQWVGTAPAKRFIETESGKRSPNPKWRPFVVRVKKSVLTSGHEALKAKATTHKEKRQVQQPVSEINEPTPVSL